MFRSHIREQAPQVNDVSCSIAKRKSDPVPIDFACRVVQLIDNIEMYKAKTGVVPLYVLLTPLCERGIAVDAKVLDVSKLPEHARRQSTKTTADIDDKTRFRISESRGQPPRLRYSGLQVESIR